MRTISKKKIYNRKTLKKSKNRKKKLLNRKRKFKGGSNNENQANQANQENKELNNSVQKVFEEQNNLALNNTLPTKKKGLISRMLTGFFPLNLLSRKSEQETIIEEKKEQNIKDEGKLKQELNNSMTEEEREKKKASQEVNSTIERVTSKDESQSLISSLGSKVGDFYKSGFKKIKKLTIGGDEIEEPKTEAERKAFKLKRQCDAEFITGLDPLLDTCSKEEVINVYNEITKKLKTKKNFFIPKLKRDIEDLRFLEFEQPKEIKMETDIKGLDIDPNAKDKIEKLQNNIKTALGAVEEKKTKLKKKSKKKKKLKFKNQPKENIEV